MIHAVHGILALTPAEPVRVNFSLWFRDQFTNFVFYTENEDWVLVVNDGGSSSSLNPSGNAVSAHSASRPESHVSFSFSKCFQLAAVVSRGHCRKCWHDRRENWETHFTFDCPSGILRDQDWKAFKMLNRFPFGFLCWYCYSPFQTPFHHAFGSIRGSDRCQFPDALKEFSYILWEDVQTRLEVFNTLGEQVPTSLQSYTGYLSTLTEGGTLGLFAVLSAYWDIQQFE